jgi:hypothetical protein
VTDEQPSHLFRLWLSEHDGYEAWVAEHEDGTFTARACRARASYIEDSFEHACAPALFGLARLSHHETCGPSCTAWQERPLPVGDYQHQHSETEN